MIDCEYLGTTTLHKIADVYGIYSQAQKATEELAECIVAISKYLPAKNMRDEAELRRALISEMADVEIMMEQLIYLLDCREEIEAEIDYKIGRQVERMQATGLLD